MSPKRLALYRIIAKSVDLAIFFLLAIVLPEVVGPLLGFLYAVLADAIPLKGFRGQSFGKKLLGLSVHSIIKNEPIHFRDSVIRNAPVGLTTFFAIIPVWGWIIMFMVGLPLLLIESYLVFRIEKGRRLGDVMADTEVRFDA